MTNAGEHVRGIYVGKATDAGLVLDADDLVVLGHLESTEDDIAALNADLARRGYMLGTDAKPFINPAVAAVRQLRVTSARLMAVLDGRLTAAKAGATGGTPGGQTGVRGIYTGTGEQNQRRDAERAERRGRGKVAR
ncbi:hypothetical protein WSS_A37759 [Rhodococcus opacus M213]|uniref:Uncharacterized protein n=1 Tax=Rhodococcus opacus M213 TaxID=1129896 RepID=K8X765_RHOOP|nr:hypothetical protein [Rhodococcus opacus]EKT77404.1 hypothetical protein WSS_A37759 [Rhodococcus opacus M213]